MLNYYFFFFWVRLRQCLVCLCPFRGAEGTSQFLYKGGNARYNFYCHHIILFVVRRRYLEVHAENNKIEVDIEI